MVIIIAAKSQFAKDCIKWKMLMAKKIVRVATTLDNLQLVGGKKQKGRAEALPRLLTNPVFLTRGFVFSSDDDF
jgi:hypothetical protein